jgi:hypothetical protein
MSGHSALVSGASKSLAASASESDGQRQTFVRSALGPSSLRWVRSLLPGEEGTGWWAEVTSCLAEIPGPGQRHQYVRSYRRSVPQLVWTSWTSQVRCVAPASVGVEHCSVN